MIVNPIVGIFTWTVTIVWTSTALGGLTYWFWQRYLPYGERDIILPYLIRRGRESKQLIQHDKDQLAVIRAELLQKIKENPVHAPILILMTGGLAWEALQRFHDPQPVAGVTVIVVALFGVFVNGVSAWLFNAGLSG